jgi:hypothetical protein
MDLEQRQAVETTEGYVRVAGESGTRYPSRFLLEMDMGGLDVARGIFL